MSVGSDGKAVLKITDLDNYKAVNFADLFAAGAAAKPSATRTAPAAASAT